MKNKSKNLLIFVIVLITLTGILSYKIYEKFQMVECTTLTDCKSCSNTFGCLWCKTSHVCVSDISANVLCKNESTVSDPFGCDTDSASADASGTNLNSPLFGGSCSNNTDCTSCLRTPDCSWCNNSQICASSVELYAKCKDDVNIYNSTDQCLTQNTIESKVPFNPNNSVIPVQGLSRNIDNSLTTPSLQIVFNGLNISDKDSMNSALNRVNDETNFYKNQYKTNINSYVNSTIDYVDDPKSLNDAKTTNQHLQDLRDISRYINDYGSAFLNQQNIEQQKMSQTNTNEFFTTGKTNNYESFVDTYTSKDEFSYVLQKNRYAARNLELYWFGTILTLGTLYYFMNLD